MPVTITCRGIRRTGPCAAITIFLIILSGGVSRAGQPDENDATPYLNFVTINGLYAKPRTIGEFERQYGLASDFLKANPYGKFTKDIKGTIIQELNIGFLLRGLNRGELRTKTGYIRQYEKYTEKKLLFIDPQVGAFSALLLLPNNKEKSYPAIIGLHGHGDSSEIFRDRYFGKELAREGFVVLLISFRAMSLDSTEDDISKKLYRKGFTLMGLRVYEALLLVKYLKQAEFADGNKLGIMGHSGGATVAYLVSRISPDLRAGVYDWSPPLLDRVPPGMHCETIPGLAYYNAQINDTATIPFNTREFKYGYPGPNDKREVINFFKNNLAMRPRGGSGGSLPGKNAFQGTVLYIPSPDYLHKEEMKISKSGEGQEGMSKLRKEKEKRSRQLSDSAVNAMRAGDFPAAQNFLREALKIYPANPEALMSLCSLRIRENKGNEALEACQSAADAVYSHPENRTPGFQILASEASLASYRLLNALGRRAEAKETLRRAVEKAPDSWPGLDMAKKELARQ